MNDDVAIQLSDDWDEAATRVLQCGLEMEIDEIRSRVKQIDHIAHVAKDAEWASGEEHALWGEFIQCIAEAELPKYSELAKAVLETVRLAFPRW